MDFHHHGLAPFPQDGWSGAKPMDTNIDTPIRRFRPSHIRLAMG